MSVPRRPVLRYHGGKWRLAPRIVEYFPPHRIYVEPFAGAASVLLRKPRAYGEIYNDLDADVVNLFRILRSDTADALRRHLELTPFARDEFVDAVKPSRDPLERARRFIIRSYMGFGSAGVCRHTTGFRANSNRSGTTPAHDWANYPECLPAIVERLVGVVIENTDAQACMLRHDAPETLHYVDPPYMPETRSTKRSTTGMYHAYRHELTVEDHVALIGFVRALKGMVVLSGYASPLYEDALRDWQRVELDAMADGGIARTEVLWINARAANHGRLNLVVA